MPSDTTDAYGAVDDAFLRLRRLWTASRQSIVLEDGRPVDISSLLVLEACARGTRLQRETAVRDVALLLDVDPSTASRVVDRAVAAGLVDKHASTQTGRHRALTLTAAGQELQRRSLHARLSWLDDRLSGWPEQDVEDFSRLLQRFADGLDRPTEQSLDGAP